VESKEAFDFRVDEDPAWSVVDVPLTAGSAILFHDLLLHASHPNTTGRDRFSMIATYRTVDPTNPDTSGVWAQGSGVPLRCTH